MANRIVFDAPVTEVTLLEDRAHVLRRGTVELTAGRATLDLAAYDRITANHMQSLDTKSRLRLESKIK